MSEVKLTQDVLVHGEPHSAGETVDLQPHEAASVVGIGRAEHLDPDTHAVAVPVKQTELPESLPGGASQELVAAAVHQKEIIAPNEQVPVEGRREPGADPIILPITEPTKGELA